MNPEIEDIVIEATKLLFTAGMPLAMAGLVGGVVSGFLQSVTSIRDTSISYASRLVGVVIGLYLTLPMLERGFVELWTLMGTGSK